jgi:nucleotide-binding universal stress UspA family protein
MRPAEQRVGMVDRVLVPIDGSEHAYQASDFVCEEFGDATMVLLHVINPAEAGYSGQAPFPTFSEDWYEQEQERAEELLDEVEAEADACGVETERIVEVGKPTRVIVEAAQEHDVDHVVMGSHGREGVSRMLLGSVAETVVRRSPVPVTVTR